MLRKHVLVVCALAMIGSTAWSATITQVGVDIDLIYTFGMSSSYVAGGGDGSGQQDIWSQNGAYVYMEDGSDVYFNNTDVQISVTAMTDNSAGDGVAKARFETGIWSISLNDPADPGNEVLALGGTVDWYTEDEINFNAPYGKALVTLDPLQTEIDAGFWGDATWGSTNGKSWFEVFFAGASPAPLEDYDTDWGSTNVTSILWADTSTIPEPITLVLLSAGAVGLLRKRRG